MNTGKKVEENSDALKNIDEKLFEIISKWKNIYYVWYLY
jgi:hypothetical protein